MAEQVDIKTYYVTRRETLVHKSIYDHLTRMTTVIVTVDEIINLNTSKAAQEAIN